MRCQEHDRLVCLHGAAARDYARAMKELKGNDCVGASELLKQAVLESRIVAELAETAVRTHDCEHGCADLLPIPMR